jgi:hypothetical protein
MQTGPSRCRAAALFVYNVLGALAGFALVIVGIITQLTVTGAIDFLLMVACTHWFLNRLPLLNEAGKAPKYH